eukprot:gene2666-3083_t
MFVPCISLKVKDQMTQNIQITFPRSSQKEIKEPNHTERSLIPLPDSIARFKRRQKRESLEIVSNKPNIDVKAQTLPDLPCEDSFESKSACNKDSFQIIELIEHEEESGHVSEREGNKLFSENENLRQEVEEWKEKYLELCEFKEKEKDKFKKEIQKHVQTSIRSSAVEGDDEKCKLKTGLSWSSFETLYEYLHRRIMQNSKTQCKILIKEQIFLTLVKLRQNPSTALMAHLSDIAVSTFVTISYRCLNLLYAKIGFLVHWPDREVIFNTVPPIFKAK